MAHREVRANRGGTRAAARRPREAARAAAGDDRDAGQEAGEVTSIVSWTGLVGGAGRRVLDENFLCQGSPS